jgi:hypothetical protein
MDLRGTVNLVVRPRTVRLLLMVLVAAGLGMMHTLGHASGEHARATGHHASMPLWPTHATAVLTTEVADTAADVGNDITGGFDPMTVCLAVLLAGFVVLLAALIVSDRRTLTRPDELRVALARGGRAPPGPALGLLLADLSVRRT